MAGYSGKFVLRVGAELHRSLREESDRLNLSLNQHCLNLLNNQLASGTDSPPWVDAIQSEWKDDLLAIFLFGSCVRGESYNDSDVDLLLVMKESFKVSRREYRKWSKLSLPERLSPHFVALPDSPEGAGSIWFEVALEGERVWEKEEHIVSSFLRDIRLKIASGKIVRKVMHGHGYWIRNFDAQQ